MRVRLKARMRSRIIWRPRRRAGDLLLVMSNGSFDGLCDKLLKKLGSRSSGTARGDSRQVIGQSVRLAGDFLFPLALLSRLPSLRSRFMRRSIRYEISVEHPEQHLFHVTMDIPDVTDEVIVQMPAWNALYQIRDFARMFSESKRCKAE